MERKNGILTLNIQGNSTNMPKDLKDLLGLNVDQLSLVQEQLDCMLKINNDEPLEIDIAAISVAVGLPGFSAPKIPLLTVGSMGILYLVILPGMTYTEYKGLTQVECWVREIPRNQ